MTRMAGGPQGFKGVCAELCRVYGVQPRYGEDTDFLALARTSLPEFSDSNGAIR